jgi:hypothetical protein
MPTVSEKVSEAVMIIFNMEMFPKKINMIDIHNIKHSHHLFFIGVFSQVMLTNLFTSKGQWYSFLHKNCAYAFSQGNTFHKKILSEVRKK